MSRVYRASLPLLGHQEYAVKLLRERCKPAEVSTFLGECTKVKRLGTHPHLVSLYFAGRDRRLLRYYVAMELVQGPPATQVLAETPAHQLPVERAVRIALQVASGLAHAHQRGILHLDVKPSNILLEAEGDLAKLTDFGSAQQQEDVAAQARHIRPGSPAYRAWELTLAGEEAGLVPDARSDVYGLAATLYHLLTGQVPQWTADGQLQPPTRWRGDVPEALEALLLSALSRDPEQRPADHGGISSHAGGVCRLPQGQHSRPAADRSQPGWLAAPACSTRSKGACSREKTLALSALGGLPGVGKTALAAAIATDPDVQAHFADGILWAGLGKSPDLRRSWAPGERHWGSRRKKPLGCVIWKPGPRRCEPASGSGACSWCWMMPGRLKRLWRVGLGAPMRPTCSPPAPPRSRSSLRVQASWPCRNSPRWTAWPC